MDGRTSGVGFPIVLGAYLLFKNLGDSDLFASGPDARFHLMLSALGLLLLTLGAGFLYRNLK